jgi:hypothetical protein
MNTVDTQFKGNDVGVQVHVLVMTMDAGQESIQIQQLGNCHC